MTKFTTLVLNRSYLPLSIMPLYKIPADEAIHRFLKGNCDVVEWYDVTIGTQNDAGLRWPSVIANHNNHSFNKDVRMRRESLFYRDHCRCVYCGKELTLRSLTLDHVKPRAKGGTHTFDNVSISCKKCNNLKSDSTSDHWKPRYKPYKPTFYQLLEIRKKYPLIVDHESWIQFLPKWTGPILIRGKDDDKITNFNNLLSSEFGEIDED
jgi:5-methylcytosine-specific restriction endonuclease McrA